MKPVGTGLQNGYDRAAIGISVGRVRIAGDDANFTDGVGSRVIADQVVLRLIVVGAFDRVVVRLFAIPVDGRDTAVVRIALDGVVSAHPGGIGIDCPGWNRVSAEKFRPFNGMFCDFVGRSVFPKVESVVSRIG